MTDNDHLTDDEWTTVDQNNNREPRKLTLISSDPNPKKSTPLSLASDSHEKIIDVDAPGSPGDFCDKPEHPNYSSSLRQHELQRRQTISIIEGHTSFLSHEAIDTTNSIHIQQRMKDHHKLAKPSEESSISKTTKSGDKLNAKSKPQNIASNTKSSYVNRKPDNSGRDKGKSPSGPEEHRRSKRDTSTESQNNRNSSRSRSTSRRKYCIEYQHRKNIGHITTEESPYACNIVELPPDVKHKSKSKHKVLLTNREHKLLDDQIPHGKKNINSNQVADDSRVIGGHMLEGDRKISDHETISSDLVETTTPFMTASMPLKSWPTFDNLHSQFLKAKDTQTNDGVRFREAGLQVDSNSSLASPSLLIPNVVSSHSQTDIDAVEFQSLEKLARKLEQGVFSASEACTVLIHTIFKESVGNTSATESVLRFPEFQNFLKSSTEIQALENVSILLRSTCGTIDNYLGTIKEVGITFPDKTNFSQKSSQIMSIASIKSIQPLVEPERSQTEVWKTVTSGPSEKFQLSLFQNPDTGDIIQTLTFQDHIFRTRFTTSEGESHQIRNILSATHEKVGMPAFINTNRLIDTIIKCSTLASTKLTLAKSQISKCYKKLHIISAKSTKSKYSVKTTTDNNLKDLVSRLQKLNVFAGIVYQVSSEMLPACRILQSGIEKAMNLHDVLNVFPRMPGFSNSKCNKDWQIPIGTQLPIQEAMIQLTEGVKGIDFAYNMGITSMQSLESKPYYKSLIHEFMEGIKVLGTNKDIDFGSLLMTLLCSTELITFYHDVMPATDPFVRANVVTLVMCINKVNSGTNELIAAIRRMEADSLILSVQTMGRLNDIRNRQQNSKL